MFENHGKFEKDDHMNNQDNKGLIAKYDRECMPKSWCRYIEL